MDIAMNTQQMTIDSLHTDLVKLIDGCSANSAMITWELILIIVLIIVVLFMCFKIITMRRTLLKINDKLSKLQSQISMLDMKDRTNNSSVAQKSSKKEVAELTKKHTDSQPLQHNVHVQQKTSSVKGKSKIRKYANIQSPDHDGNLKISERTMLDVASATKPFVVEYENGSTSATYTINPGAIGTILNELQTYEYCFKSVVINKGVAQKISQIIPVKDGKLEKQGQYWIVTEKMEVKFK